MRIIRDEDVIVEGEVTDKNRWERWCNKAKKIYQDHKAECSWIDDC